MLLKKFTSIVLFVRFVKVLFIFSVGIALLSSCSTSTQQIERQQAQQTSTSNKQEVDSEPLFPERLRINMYYSPRWQSAVLTHATDDRYTLEFWPYGQHKASWKEVIQISYYDKKVNAHDLAQHIDTYQDQLQQKCSAIEFKTLSQKQDELVYTWSVNSCDAIEQQYEIGRYIKTPNGIHHMIYVSKGEVPAEKYFKRWVKAVESAEVINAKKYAKIKPQKDVAWRR